MEIDDIVKGLWKRRLLVKVWIAFTAITFVAMVLFFIRSGDEITSYINVKDGNVTVYEKSTGSWDSTDIGHKLGPGSKIRTASASTAEIRFDDGSFLRMLENSEVHILAFYSNPWQGIRTVNWKQVHGNYVVDAGGKVSLYEIVTKTGTIRIEKGTCLITDNEVKPLTEGCIVTHESGGSTQRIPFGEKLTFFENGRSNVSAARLNNKDKELLLQAKPKLIIDESYIETEESVIIITGETNPGNKVSVDNFSPVIAESNGRFEITINDHPFGRVERFVTSEDKANRETSKAITIFRKKPKEMTEHSLEIISPIDNTITDSATIKITGNIQGSVRLFIGTTEITHSEGIFEYSYPLYVGKQVIEVSSVDADGNKLRKWRNVERVKSLELASISITSPKKGLKTDNTNIDIRGITNTKNVLFKGEKINVVNGVFKVNVRLDYGNNILVFVAKDDEHKQTSAEISVYRKRSDAPSPTIRIDDYKKITDSSTIVIYGSVKNTSTLTFGDETISVSPEGKFQKSLSLKEGKNHFEIIATSSGGNRTKKELEIICDLTKPDLSKLKARRDPTTGNVTIMGEIEALTKFYVEGIDMTLDAVTVNAETGIGSILKTIKNHTALYIKIQAVDLAGNINERSIPIESDKKTP